MKAGVHEAPAESKLWSVILEVFSNRGVAECVDNEQEPLLPSWKSVSGITMQRFLSTALTCSGPFKVALLRVPEHLVSLNGQACGCGKVLALLSRTRTP